MKKLAENARKLEENAKEMKNKAREIKNKAPEVKNRKKNKSAKPKTKSDNENKGVSSPTSTNESRPSTTEPTNPHVTDVVSQNPQIKEVQSDIHLLVQDIYDATREFNEKNKQLYNLYDMYPNGFEPADGIYTEKEKSEVKKIYDNPDNKILNELRGPVANLGADLSKLLRKDENNQNRMKPEEQKKLGQDALEILDRYKPKVEIKPDFMNQLFAFVNSIIEKITNIKDAIATEGTKFASTQYKEKYTELKNAVAKEEPAAEDTSKYSGPK